MPKERLLFVINQFFKGGAETALLNLFNCLSSDDYEIDFLIFDQIDLPDTVSLVGRIPEWVRVINVAGHEKGRAFIKKAYFKAYKKLTCSQLFRKAAVDYVKAHTYDVAISYGEWFSSSLVGRYAQASRKYVWIHADMDKAAFLNPDIEKMNGCFDGFIFASEASRKSAEQRYSFLRHCSYVVNNVVNGDDIRQSAQNEVELPEEVRGRPLLLTVANLRNEKNHLRQVEAMRILRNRGMDFCWLNIGSTANYEQTRLIKQAVGSAGLEKDFLILGARENPYAYMKHADAVCVLSDHESWSMVITEAKMLGIPVIATKTSGAQEQIEHGETGILCDFTAESIADQIQAFLNDPDKQAHIREQLSAFACGRDQLAQFRRVIHGKKKSCLYVFDDINYRSGMRTAGLMRMEYQQRKEQAVVDAFSIEPCRDEQVSERWRVLDLGSQRALGCLSKPFGEVLRSDRYKLHHKLLRLAYAVSVRIRMEEKLCNRVLQKSARDVLERYDAVYVMSEASKLRSCVAELKHPKKIQYIHTDYAAWREQTNWTRSITAHDAQIYAHYNEIAFLSQRLKERFCKIYPQLSDRATVVPNLIPVDEIRRKAEEHCPYDVNPHRMNLITIGRMEWEKRYDRLLEVARLLKKRNFPFHWFFVGDGGLMGEIRDKRSRLGLETEVTLTGAMENPYPLLKRCDLFVLISEYEGTPVTIEECKALGVPVLASDVGGIADMIADNSFGRIVSNGLNTQEIVDEICFMHK